MQEETLILIELHSSLYGIGYPRSDMIFLLIYIMENYPNFFQKAKDSFLKICNKIQPPKNEADKIEIYQILDGLKSTKSHIRLTCLQGLENISFLLSPEFPIDDVITTYLWFVCYDINEENSTLAKKLWNLYNHPLTQDYFSFLSPLLFHSSTTTTTQIIASLAIAAAIKQYPNTFNQVLSCLLDFYKMNLPTASSITEDKNKHIRIGVAIALSACSSLFTLEQLTRVIDFLLNIGLFDVNDEVRQYMVQAGLDITENQGNEKSSQLLSFFENFMLKPSENVILYFLKLISIIN